MDDLPWVSLFEHIISNKIVFLTNLAVCDCVMIFASWSVSATSPCLSRRKKLFVHFENESVERYYPLEEQCLHDIFIILC